MSFDEIYSVRGYGEMISDRVRMEAYASALEQAMTPDASVVDIGTGTGIFALLACRFGARRVYAIEPSVSVQLAREIAVANGVAERIEFIDKLSTEVELPERVDVVISDLRSVLPTFQHHFAAVQDARERFLAPGGTLIPQCDKLYGAVVEAASTYRSVVGGYADNGYDFDMSAALRYVTSEWRKGNRLTAESLRTPAQRWATLDYRVFNGPDVSGDLEWTVSVSGAAHGLCVWFDTELASGIGFSNAPGSTELIYNRAFFPWPQCVELKSGDRVSATLSATQSDGQYIWSWRTRIRDAGTGDEIHDFQQSTLNRVPLSVHQLRKRTDRYVPQPTPEARIHLSILSAFESGSTLGEVAQLLLDKFPDDFATWDTAFREVADLAERYG